MNATKRPHRLAEIIHAWADGETIQFNEGSGWNDLEARYTPMWGENVQYRVKPREFPKSSLSAGSLCQIWERCEIEFMCENYSLSKTLARVADEAVKQHILDCEAAEANAF